MAAKSKKDPNAMSFLDHLEELRWHIVRSGIAVLVGAVVAFIFVDVLFDGIILAPLHADFYSYLKICELSQLAGGSSFCFDEMNIPIQSTKYTGLFMMHMNASIVAGIIIAFPYIVYELWRFIKPGLHERERKNGSIIIFFTAFLFLFGVLFGYYVLSPLSVQFFGTYQLSDMIEYRPELSSYVSLITMMTLATGLLFELPVMVYFFSSIGLLTPEWMRKYRRHAIVVVLIFAAIITPPDVLSQVLVAIPVMGLYQISIAVSARVQKRRKARTV